MNPSGASIDTVDTSLEPAYVRPGTVTSVVASRDSKISRKLQASMNASGASIDSVDTSLELFSAWHSNLSCSFQRLEDQPQTSSQYECFRSMIHRYCRHFFGACLCLAWHSNLSCSLQRLEDQPQTSRSQHDECFRSMRRYCRHFFGACLCSAWHSNLSCSLQRLED